MLIQTHYHEIRKGLQDGDVIAFGGKGEISNLIKLFTRSPVSHVALVMKAKLEDGNPLNLLIESTVLDGYSGVVVNRLSNRLRDYTGEAWWLPLNQHLRAKANWEGSYDWLKGQRRKAYDTKQAVGAWLDLIWNNKEDFDRFFCSELVSAFYEKIRVIESINSSEVIPIDACRFNIYDANYYQIAGELKEIPGYNTMQPGNWIL